MVTSFLCVVARERKDADYGKLEMPTRQPQPVASCNVYVASLPPSYTDSQLYDLMAHFGRIVSARVMCDPRTGQCKGYGFVLFESEREAAIAIDGLAGHAIDGHRIQVRAAHLAASPQLQKAELGADKLTQAGGGVPTFFAPPPSQWAPPQQPAFVHVSSLQQNPIHMPMIMHTVSPNQPPVQAMNAPVFFAPQPVHLQAPMQLMPASQVVQQQNPQIVFLPGGTDFLNNNAVGGFANRVGPGLPFGFM